MPRVALLLLLAPAAVIAAPVPQDAQTEERFLKLYGTRFDERKQARFTLAGDRLSVALVGHVEEPQDPLKPPPQPSTPFDSPRVLREVSGDFVARVGVKCPQPPTPGSLVHAFSGGGIFVILGDGHYFSAERYHCLRYDDGAKVIWDGSFESTVRKLKPATNVSCYSSHRASIDPLPVRLTRRGDTFTAEATADGKKWETLQTVKVPAGDKLLVGLFTRHNTKEPVEIVFVGYTITKPE